MYLKNANKGIFTIKVQTAKRERPAFRYGVLSCFGEVVYGCTTPLIHGCERIGCLSKKFFLNFFSIQVYLFSSEFFFFFLFFFLANDGRSEYICSALDWFCFILLVVISSVFPLCCDVRRDFFEKR